MIFLILGGAILIIGISVLVAKGRSGGRARTTNCQRRNGLQNDASGGSWMPMMPLMFGNEAGRPADQNGSTGEQSSGDQGATSGSEAGSGDGGSSGGGSDGGSSGGGDGGGGGGGSD